MPEWVKMNLPLIVIACVGAVSTYSTLENKFTNLETQRSKEGAAQVSILTDISNDIKLLNAGISTNAKDVAELSNKYSSLEHRVDVIFKYVPGSITQVEKDVLRMQGELNLIKYIKEQDNDKENSSS